MNAHAAIATRVSAAVLTDIEGLDADKHGFSRDACCKLPDDLPGSFEPLKLHVFTSTEIPTTEWAKLALNVPGYGDLNKKMKGADAAKVTVFGREGADHVIMTFKHDEKTNGVTATQYSGGKPDDLPWESPGALAVDRSEERFVFVCSHRTRDERCGYCGPVLVDLMRQAIAAKHGANAPFHVYPCSHVGGHTYAGNVLVYSKHGGRCFGCVTPADIDEMVSFITQHSDASIPANLQPKLRGAMGMTKADK